MTRNNKPVLSILIDRDKRERFAEFARRKNLSMGYLVNQAIDRMLDGNDIGQIGSKSPESISRSDVEEIVKTCITESLEDIRSEVRDLKRAISDREKV